MKDAVCLGRARSAAQEGQATQWPAGKDSSGKVSDLAASKPVGAKRCQEHRYGWRTGSAARYPVGGDDYGDEDVRYFDSSPSVY